LESGRAFAVSMRTAHRDQASFCPFALREVSVLAELALGHLRYSLTDVSCHDFLFCLGLEFIA